MEKDQVVVIQGKKGDRSKFLIDKSSQAYGNTVYAAAKEFTAWLGHPFALGIPHGNGRVRGGKLKNKLCVLCGLSGEDYSICKLKR